MTKAQRFKFYFPLWSKACHSNGWSASTLKARAGEASLSEYPTEWTAKVETFARQRGLMAQRPVTLDDLRHGAHIVSLGKDKSSELLTNAELDRVATLFRLLTDPEDLDALMAWENPSIGEQRRLDWFIEHSAPEAYVRHLSVDRFGTSTWEFLSLGQKRRLAMTLAERRKQNSKLQAPNFKQYSSGHAHAPTPSHGAAMVEEPSVSVAAATDNNEPF